MFQEPKTARMAVSSCSMGSVGKSRFMRRLKKALYCATSSFKSSAVSSVSCLTPRFSFIWSISRSNFARSRCSATEENIVMKRR